MFYSPHTLYVRRQEVERDDYGRPIQCGETWTEVCRCRCDENQTREITTEDGKVFRPQYHIVCPRDIDVQPNDDIRVMNGERVRGEGKVYNVNHLNMLDYSELWV